MKSLWQSPCAPHTTNQRLCLGISFQMHAHNFNFILTYSFLHYTRFTVGTETYQTFFEVDTHQCMMPGFPMCVLHKTLCYLYKCMIASFFLFLGNFFVTVH